MRDIYFQFILVSAALCIFILRLDVQHEMALAVFRINDLSFDSRPIHTKILIFILLKQTQEILSFRFGFEKTVLLFEEISSIWGEGFGSGFGLDHGGALGVGFGAVNAVLVEVEATEVDSLVEGLESGWFCVSGCVLDVFVALGMIQVSNDLQLVKLRLVLRNLVSWQILFLGFGVRTQNQIFKWNFNSLSRNDLSLPALPHIPVLFQQLQLLCYFTSRILQGLFQFAQIQLSLP